MTVEIKYAIAIAAHSDLELRPGLCLLVFWNLVVRKRIKVASRRNELRDKKNEKPKLLIASIHHDNTHKLTELFL